MRFITRKSYVSIKDLVLFFMICTLFFGPNISYAGDQNLLTKQEKSTEAETQEKKEESKEEEKKDKTLIHEIEVVAKRIPEAEFNTDRSVSVFHDESLSQQVPRTVPEALGDTPGTFVQHTNSGGGSPILRGMIGPQILITVDGIRFNNSTYRTGPGQYLNLIDVHSIDQIEVLRGPGSVLYGSDAMGGVIQVIPLRVDDRQYQDGWGVNGGFLSRYSSADMGRILNGHFDLGCKNLSFLGGVSIKKFDDLRGGEDIGKQPYVGYDQVSSIGKIVYRFTEGSLENWIITFGALSTRLDDAGRIDKLYDANSLQVYDNTDHLIYGRLHMEYPGIRSYGDLTISYQDFYELKDAHKVEDDYKTIVKTTRDEVSAGTIGVDLNMVMGLFEDFRMSYGGMWYRDSVDADRLGRNNGQDWQKSSEQSYPDGSNYANYGAYAFLEWEPMKGKTSGLFRLSGGYRLHGMSASVPAKNNLPAVDFSHTGHVFTLGAQYLYGNLTNISLTFSQGFRSPNMQESVMLGDTGKFFHIPNYSLKPERSDTFELLIRGHVGRMIMNWSGYVSLLKDIIKRDGTVWKGLTTIDGKEVVFNVNGGKGILWGSEGNMILDLGKGFLASANATYTWGEERISGMENIPLTRIPPLFGQVKIHYDALDIFEGESFLEAYIRAAAKQSRLSNEDIKDVRIPPGGTPGWWTLNFRAGTLLTRHVRLTFSIENILNKKYKYHASGIYNAGTNVIISLGFL